MIAKLIDILTARLILRKHQDYSEFIAQDDRRDVVKLLELAAKQANEDQKKAAELYAK